MARVFLHIGGHKTGTSHLQALFYNNRKRLAEAGIHYPDIGPNNAHHALATTWLDLADFPEWFLRENPPERIWNRLVGTYARAGGTVFLSAENLTRMHPQIVDYRDLALRLAAFDEVRVIYTMRRQTELVQSLWMQVAKTRRAPTLRSYVERALDKRLGGGVPIDHLSVYQRLLQGFRPDQITLLDYGQTVRAPGGMARAFLRLMGSDLDPATLVQPSRAESNPSPDPLALLAACQMMRDAIPDDALIGFLQPIVHPDPQVPATLLAPHEYSKLHSRFCASNDELSQLVQPVQPGFHFDNGTPPENLIYRDALDTQTWIAIAAALHAHAPLTGPDDPVTPLRQTVKRLLGRD